MRRADRQVSEIRELREIMQRCDAVCLALAGEAPYAVPMSFGYEEREGRFALYMHSAMEGEKISRIRRDARAAFAMYTGNRIIEGQTACAYSTTYESVCGSGVIAVLEGEEKRRGLEILMRHYAPDREPLIEERVLARTCVMRLDVQEISGKRRGG